MSAVLEVGVAPEYLVYEGDFQYKGKEKHRSCSCQIQPLLFRGGVCTRVRLLQVRIPISHARAERVLSEMGARLLANVSQKDEYWQDEMGFISLRIRRENNSDTCLVTAQVCQEDIEELPVTTRIFWELTCSEKEARRMTRQMRKVQTVEKNRSIYWTSELVCVNLDHVSGVGPVVEIQADSDVYLEHVLRLSKKLGFVEDVSFCPPNVPALLLMETKTKVWTRFQREFDNMVMGASGGINTTMGFFISAVLLSGTFWSLASAIMTAALVDSWSDAASMFHQRRADGMGILGAFKSAAGTAKGKIVFSFMFFPFLVLFQNNLQLAAVSNFVLGLSMASFIGLYPALKEGVLSFSGALNGALVTLGAAVLGGSSGWLFPRLPQFFSWLGALL